MPGKTPNTELPELEPDRADALVAACRKSAREVDDAAGSLKEFRAQMKASPAMEVYPLALKLKAKHDAKIASAEAALSRQSNPRSARQDSRVAALGRGQGGS